MRECAVNILQKMRETGLLSDEFQILLCTVNTVLLVDRIMSRHENYVGYTVLQTSRPLISAICSPLSSPLRGLSIRAQV